MQKGLIIMTIRKIGKNFLLGTFIKVYELLEEGKKATREDIVNILEKAREKKGISHIHFCFSEERP